MATIHISYRGVIPESTPVEHGYDIVAILGNGRQIQFVVTLYERDDEEAKKVVKNIIDDLYKSSITW